MLWEGLRGFEKKIQVTTFAELRDDVAVVDAKVYI